MKSLAVVVSGGSTNNLIQVLTLLMAAVHSDMKVRVLFRDESVYRLRPSAINTVDARTIAPTAASSFSR